MSSYQLHSSPSFTLTLLLQKIYVDGDQVDGSSGFEAGARLGREAAQSSVRFRVMVDFTVDETFATLLNQ